MGMTLQGRMAAQTPCQAIRVLVHECAELLLPFYLLTHTPAGMPAETHSPPTHPWLALR
jgi:hypothetical protein